MATGLNYLVSEWIILVLSIFVQLSSAADSEGTLWYWAFIRNANPDITNQMLSVTGLICTSHQLLN